MTAVRRVEMLPASSFYFYYLPHWAILWALGWTLKSSTAFHKVSAEGGGLLRVETPHWETNCSSGSYWNRRCCSQISKPKTRSSAVKKICQCVGIAIGKAFTKLWKFEINCLSRNERDLSLSRNFLLFLRLLQIWSSDPDSFFKPRNLFYVEKYDFDIKVT